MMRLSRWAIEHPIAITVLMAAVVVLGTYGLIQLPVNLLPDVTYPLVKMTVNWPGATPEDIEQNIADVVERKLATVDNLDYIESECTEGMYDVRINFTYGTDVDVAYQDVLAKMGTVRKRLPADAEAPVIIKADPSQLSVVDLAIQSDTMDMVELRTWVDNYLQDQFTAVQGSAGTEVAGGLQREIRVDLDQEALQARGLAPNDVASALEADNIQMLAGWVTGPRSELVARTLAEYASIEDLQSVIVAKDAAGRPVFLQEVAEVSDSHKTQRVVTALNEEECVKLSVFKQTDANTIDVADAVEAKIAELSETLPEGVQMAVTYNASDYVKRSVASVRDAAIIAAVLVVLVTAFFLTGWQRILVVALTLPLSLLGAFFGAHLLGFSINIFSLGGLVVAISVLLDNCVVVLENIVRLQTEHPDEPHPVRRGADEVAGAVIAATITFMVLFLPFLLVPGLASLLFREVMILIALIILVSLIVALTVTPSLIALFFPEGSPVAERRGPVAELSHRTMHALHNWYRPVLRRSLAHPYVVLGAVGLLSIAGLASYSFLGSEFLPQVDDGRVMAKVKMPPGTAVEETNRALERVEQALDDVPFVKQTFRLTGGRVKGMVTYESAYEGELDIQLVPPHDRPVDTDQWVDKYGPQITRAAMVPGARIRVSHRKIPGLRQRGTFPVQVDLRAPRTEPMEQMAQLAAKVRGEIKDVPGLTKLDVSIDVSKPELQVLVDRAVIGDLGLSAEAVARNVRTFVNGVVPTRFHEGGYYYDIRMRLPEGVIQDAAAVEQLVMPAPHGGTYVLGDVARVVSAVGPTLIERYDQMRIISVTADTAGVSDGVANARVAEELRDFQPPPGYTMRMGAGALEMRENFQSLALILSLAMFFAYVVLAIQFESLSLPFIVMLRVPLSLAGVSLALLLTGTQVGITVLIGIVILAGIEVNHGVVLLTYVRQLQESGLGLQEAIVEGTIVRLRPVMMTLLTCIFGLLPLALGIGEGTELLRPMAVGVIGGLFFSIVLTFFFMPVAYLLFGRRKERARLRAEDV